LIDKTPIDPYFLGLLLGDSCLRDAPIKFTNADVEALEYVQNISTNMGLCRLQKRKTERSNIFIGSFRKRNNFLRIELEKLKLWGKLGYQKFTPNTYKFGSRNVRFAMLSGLIDSDGSRSQNNSICYDTTSERLANDVAFVSRSLGFGVSIRNPQTFLNKKWKPIYSVCVFGDFSEMLLLVSRKIPRPRQSNKNVLKTGFSIHKLKIPVTYYKLEFESEDQHFLKSDFMVLKGGSSYVM
jgi:intein/homing endonuclease